ncbi:MAG: tripartite tricarboxylate transporter substrate-binding protein [Deltaproteobacteria bacterium]|nr:tripartite tricarboxylate transporter substrate-binding protein [Deltaproteobacteria bacterium]
MNRRSATLAAMIAALFFTLGTATWGAAEVSFKGKTVAILIPYSVGGAADIMARQMLPFIGKQIPGNPTTIIKNMPGGGGIVGENWVYNSAPADGTIIGQFSTSVTDTIFKPDKVKFELAKLQWLGGVRETTVTFVSKDLGITKGTELGGVKKKLFFGTTSIQSPRSMIPRLLLKILGKDHKLVTGYGSSGDMRAAIRRGELNMTNDSQSGYFAAVLPMVEEGAVVPIAQEGTVQDGKIIRDPRLPDLPTYYEIVLELKGESVRKDPNYRAMELLAYLGGVRRGWVYAARVPKNVFDTMAASFDRFLKDKEMSAHFKKAIGFDLVSLNAPAAQSIIDKVVEIQKRDPEALEILKAMAQKP